MQDNASQTEQHSLLHIGVNKHPIAMKCSVLEYGKMSGSKMISYHIYGGHVSIRVAFGSEVAIGSLGKCRDGHNGQGVGSGGLLYIEI